jgi:hypothetical protein
MAKRKLAKIVVVFIVFLSLNIVSRGIDVRVEHSGNVELENRGWMGG